MPSSNYYDVLGVSPSDDAMAIKKAYKRLAMKYHPDRNKDNANAQDTLKAINHAYDVLSDSNKRQMYDRFGEDGLRAGASNQQQGGFEGVFDDIFGNIFGGGQRRSTSSARNGSDFRIAITIDLAQTVTGCKQTVRINMPTLCDDCKGSGAMAGSGRQTCKDCDGHGAVRSMRGPFSVEQTCARCHGAGTVIDKPCRSCRGQGQVEKPREHRIDIPVGIDNGNVLNVRGQGGPGIRGGSSGNLLVEISVRPHEIFSRQGADLYCEIPVSISELVLGTQLRIPTLDGEVAVKLPAGTASGKRLRIKSKGIAHLRHAGHGDLFCTVMANTPTRLSARQRALFEELQEIEAKEAQSNKSFRGVWISKVREFFN